MDDQQKCLFECDLCDKKYTSKQNLFRHQSRTHQRVPKGSKCALCEFIVPTIITYVNHLKSSHQIDVVIEEKKFQTEQEFELWKSRIEKETASFYCSRRKSAITWYNCNRSGNFETQGKGLRHIKISGSRKINSKCSSCIKKWSDSEQINVIWWKTHVGHEAELKHINIPRVDKLDLASYLSIGIPKNKILEKIRSSWSEEHYDRVHLTTNKDLSNIARDKNIKSQVCRDKNDLTSVESWVEEMRASEQDPVILYEFVEGKVFNLGISTIGQRYILEKYGNNIIAIDSTHGTNDYGFQLTTVMVVDENRAGFPIAYLYSVTVDTQTLKRFFLALKDIAQIKKIKTFMSDDYPAFYNAWSEVFQPPENHLICTWHVYRNWNKNLNLLKDTELRNTLRADTFRLQRELDHNHFLKLLDVFKKKYSANTNAIEFMKYFASYYLNRVEMWAACYRLSLGINTNMYLEILHRSLKYVYMQGRKVRRMDESINVLMKLTYNMQYERLIRKEKGYVPKKLEDLRSRHKTALNTEFSTSKDPEDVNSFLVVSSKANDACFYNVKILRSVQNCLCLLKCSECKFCIHEVCCDCYDAAIKGNMCKHIHFIALRYAKELNSGSHENNSFDNELVVHESNYVPDIDDERNFMLSQNKQPESYAIEEVKLKMEEQFKKVLSLCTEQRHLDSIKGFLNAMEPTIRALELSGNKTMVSNTEPKDKARKIVPQRRFWKKAKRPRRLIFDDSNLDKEILSQSLVNE